MAVYPLAPPAVPQPGGALSVRALEITPVASQRFYKIRMSATADLKDPTYARLTVGYSDSVPPVVTDTTVYVTDPALKFAAVRVVDAKDNFMSNYSPTVAIDVGTVPPPVTHPTAKYPSGVLPLRNQKLTIPFGTAESPTEIRQPKLATYVDQRCFYVDGDAVIFNARCGAPTTSGSGYPRCEEREMTADGSNEIAWPSGKGVNSMFWTAAVLEIPVEKPHVVVGQIHNPSNMQDDIVVFRLEGGDWWISEKGKKVFKICSGYKLGTKFVAGFKATKNGIECWWNGKVVYTVKGTYLECYFKLGIYVQSNTSNGGKGFKGDKATAGGRVAVYAQTIRHDA